MRLRFFVLIGLLASLCVSMVGPVTPAAATVQTGTARVRFANAGIDVPALNVYAEGRLWASGITETVGYLDIPAGSYTFTFQLPRRDEPLASVDVSLEADQRVTVAASGTVDALDAIAFVDDVSAPARNAARLRVVHVAPALDAVQVHVGEETLAANLLYGEAGAPHQVITGVHDITVETLDGDPVLSVPGTFFNPNRAYTLFLTGDADQPDLLITNSSVLRAPTTTQFRFAHMAPAFGPLLVYVNGEALPVFDAINFSSVTPYVITGQGAHTVDVYATGSTPEVDPPLASVTADIGAQQDVVFTATGDAETLTLTAYVTDLSPLPPQSTRLHVIHAAPGNAAARVTTLDGLPLVERVEPGEMAARVVPSGTYNVRLLDSDIDRNLEDDADSESDGDTDGETDPAIFDPDALLMERAGLDFPPGTATALIVFDDNVREPLVNAVVVAADNVATRAALRWLHVDAAGEPVDVYLDGEALLTDWALGDATGHTLFDPRLYTLSVYPAGVDPAVARPLLNERFDLRGTASPRTALLFGAPDALRLVTLPDSAALLPANRGRVRFIHAAGLERLSVQNTTSGALLAETLTPGTGSVNVNLPPGTYTFDVLSDGTTVTTLDPLTVEAGTTYTVVIADAPIADVAADAASDADDATGSADDSAPADIPLHLDAYILTSQP